MYFPPVIVTGLDHCVGWSTVFPTWLTLLGFMVIAWEYAFAAWALTEDHLFSSVIRIQTDRGHLVCDTAPYRIERHPGYAGSLLPLAGIVLALGSI